MSPSQTIKFSWLCELFQIYNGTMIYFSMKSKLSVYLQHFHFNPVKPQSKFYSETLELCFKQVSGIIIIIIIIISSSGYGAQEVRQACQGQLKGAGGGDCGQWAESLASLGLEWLGENAHFCFLMILMWVYELEILMSSDEPSVGILILGLGDWWAESQKWCCRGFQLNQNSETQWMVALRRECQALDQGRGRDMQPRDGHAGGSGSGGTPLVT